MKKIYLTATFFCLSLSFPVCSEAQPMVTGSGQDSTSSHQENVVAEASKPDSLKNNLPVIDMPKESPKEEKSHESERGSSSFLTWIALLLGIAGSLTAVMAFLRLSRLEQNHRKTKASYKKAIENLREDVANQKALVSNLLGTVNNLKDKVGKMAIVPPPAPVSNPDLKTTAPESAETYGTRIQQTAPRNDAPAAPVKLYFGAPSNGVFTAPTRQYIPGKSLYIVIDKGVKNAEFSFIENSDTAAIAARSVSRFIESGCVIAGEQRSSFSKVVTRKPGVVVKTPTGWMIDSKATVELC